MKLFGTIFKISLVTLGASAVNVLLFFALARLNDAVDTTAPVPPRAPRLLRLEPDREIPEIPEPPAEEEIYEPEPMDLDVAVEPPPPMTDPTPVPMDVSLDLSIASMSPVVVAAAPITVPRTDTPRPQRRPLRVRSNVQQRNVQRVQAGPRRADRVDQPPKEFSSNKRPRYPRVARRRRIRGRVTVKLLIDESGFVTTCSLVSVTGHKTFGKEVLDVCRGWRFEAARHRGRRVKVWAVKSIDFVPGR